MTASRSRPTREPSPLDRDAFERRIEAEIGNRKASGRFALLYIDIARMRDCTEAFKPAPRLGDDGGVAAGLAALLGPADFLAKFGDDAFAVHQAGAGAEASLALARRILDTLGETDIDRHLGLSHPSIGIGLYPRDGASRAELASHAESALYRAKQEDGHRVVLFDQEQARQLRLRTGFADAIVAAMANGDLGVAYQPLVAGASGKVVCLEALMRWQHPVHGVLSPEDFIPLAEARGIILPLGEWMLRRACREARRWPGLRMAVNVSPVQFRHKGFVGMVAQILEETGLEPGRLELELTEGVVIHDAGLAEASILELRALGVRIALDDFGTGYSSLLYLRRFAFDKIKIDKSFLQSMEPDGEGGLIVRHVVQLGQALGLTVTAEGIETPEQAQFLRSLGCDELQGFLFSAPLDADDVDVRVSELAWAADGEGPARVSSQGRSVA